MNKDYIARYEQVAGYKWLSFGKYNKVDKNQTATNKQKSRDHGEVFTPLWIVDEMVEEAIKQLGTEDLTTVYTHDCCAGYGAFTIRLAARHRGNTYRWLKKKHLMTEYQLSSAFKLIYIFGKNINLLIGDANIAMEWMKTQDTMPGIKLWDGTKYVDFSNCASMFLSEVTKDNLNEIIEKYERRLIQYLI